MPAPGPCRPRPTSHYFRLGLFGEELSSRPVYDRNCSHNLLIAIRNRALFDTGLTVDGQVLKELRLVLRHWRRSMNRHVKPLTYDCLISRYSGRKRANYEAAFAKVQRGVSLGSAFKVKAFIKYEPNEYETVQPDGTLGKAKEPRLIQFCDYPGNLQLLRYTLPIEHTFFSTPIRHRWFPRDRFIAKGETLDVRATRIASAWARMRRPVAILGDLSRADAHVRPETKRAANAFYASFVEDPRERKELQALLEMTVRCKAHASYETVNGGSDTISYVTNGQVCSGEATTGGGHCIRVAGMLALALGKRSRLRRSDYWFYVDGDDFIIILEQRHEQTVRASVVEVFNSLGFKLELDSASVVEHVEFCRSRPVRTAGGWTMVRNPRRVLTTALTGTRFAQGTKTRRKYVRAVADSELFVQSGVPVLQAYAQYLNRSAGEIVGFPPDHPLAPRAYQRRRAAQGLPVDDDARMSFFRAWGIDIATQFALERWLERHTLDLRVDPVPTDPVMDHTLFQSGPRVYPECVEVCA